MEKVRTIQKLRKVETEVLTLAQRYYTILSAVNGLKLTEREIQLVSYTAIKGNISYSSNREEFCSLYGSSSATINNIISKLKKINILVKEASKIKVNPVILLDFKKDIYLGVKLELHEKTQE